MSEKVYIKTFGCQMNEYDSEKMISLLSQSHLPVSTPEEADLVLINTCSVREKAEHKLFSLLGRIRELKKDRPEVVVGVTGCVAQQEGGNIISRERSVDFVVGTHNLSLIPSLVEQVKNKKTQHVAIDYREEWEELPDAFDAVPRDIRETSAYRSTVRAMVAIQRGCNKNCSYCVVPYTRGPETSRLPEEILREIRVKVHMGAKEVLLLGQTVNSYGKDLSPRFYFHQLIEKIAEIPGLERIRFTSPHPADLKPEFISMFRDIPQLCPHLHMPLQSGNDRILRAMNRNYKIKRYLEIIDMVRSSVPDIELTTDIIVGFPTETEEEFLDTLKVVQEVEYQSAFYFKYSPRPHTTAIEQYLPEDHCHPEVLQERFARLHDLQRSINCRRNSKYVGTIQSVLLEGMIEEEGSFFLKGRTPQNIWVHNIPAKLSEKKVGDTIQVQIVHASEHGLSGLPIFHFRSEHEYANQ